MNIAPWEEFWSALRLGEGVEQGAMKIFPLSHHLSPKVDYLTLEEALNVGGAVGITVQEVSERGSITELRVVNGLDRPVLLFEGEILLGAKQNRTLHTTVLVGQSSEVKIPVACVEAGRWSDAPRGGFGISGHYAHANLRYEKLRHAATTRGASGREAGEGRSAPAVNQGEVWSEVAVLSSLAGVHSATGDAEEVYQGLKSKARSRYDFEYSPGSAGMAVCIDGRLVGVECFDRPSTMEKMFPRLVQSYVLEALRRDVLKDAGNTPSGAAPGGLSRSFVHLLRKVIRGRSPERGAAPPAGGKLGDTPSQVEAFMREVGMSEVTSDRGVGLGDDLRAHMAEWSAAALIYQGKSLYGQALLRNAA